MAGQRARIFGWCEPSAYCRKHGMTRDDLDNAGRDAERRGGSRDGPRTAHALKTTRAPLPIWKARDGRGAQRHSLYQGIFFT